MRPFITDSLSVRRSVGLSQSWPLQKPLNPSIMSFGMWTQVGPRKHIGATWRMPLNRPCTAAMRPFCQMTLTTCCYYFVFRKGVMYCDQRICMSICVCVYCDSCVRVSLDCGSVLPPWRQSVDYVLPVLWMTSYFHIMDHIQIQSLSVRRSELFTARRQKAAPNCVRGRSLLWPIALLL